MFPKETLQGRRKHKRELKDSDAKETNRKKSWGQGSKSLKQFAENSLAPCTEMILLFLL